MSYPGATPPPPGAEPNMEYPADVLWTINYLTQALTLIFTTGFVATRFYAKYKVMEGGMTKDDASQVATYFSFVLMVGYCVTALIAGQYGMGHNQWEVSPKDLTSFLKCGYAATIFYAPMALGVKLSLLFITIRVFGTVHRKTTIGIYIFIGMLVAYYVSGLFIKIFICKPISSYWMGDVDKCLDQNAIITADAIISVVSDLAILFLPTPLTWSLQLSMRKRLRVIGILCAGGVATGFSIYRLAMILNARDSANQTLVFTKVILSGNAEAGIGLICACLPSISALIVRRNGYASRGYKSSGPADLSRHGEIMLTRSYQVETSKKGQHDPFHLGNDEAGLIASIQANSKSDCSSRARTPESA
ncbi:unnamed protein product [Fusarium graminearum]|uniref:Chromosome 4, complete genome n=2 Tax=Gibberella zeae TaxID=5518 RepID=I1RUF1_GIBZE|nr:hypothetical protein FGSG_07841 [Fusarium graminearum PH-1]CAF3452807.1 unnamed protein product [Fusarium graminearum]ESU14159.1 hypothetical protein FGSG_07841 [Fusarium graminearum PH-1]CAF3495040.1 unnamed protein product [Fusarium graminearum]CAG1963569.1 unnamed protein product [Fusarium graminearum]CAG1979435.1 unnamed protein product [Fusarium graminearum]|eukprot:XP_011327666.1 hypothetical protein FGSG_07841 [Fusarium graminearum PH-1]